MLLYEHQNAFGHPHLLRSIRTNHHIHHSLATRRLSLHRGYFDNRSGAVVRSRAPRSTRHAPYTATRRR
jgi:hypothetical protein